MHRILTELEQKIQECLRTYLPEVKKSELEENGTVYYMNGKNGTEFDWHVNDRLSDFMVFYSVPLLRRRAAYLHIRRSGKER